MAEVIYNGDMKEFLIKNKHGSFIIRIDDIDIGVIKNKNVRVIYQRGLPRTVTVSEKGERNGKILSRLIMKPERNMVVDHINRNPLDNRRINMRICTQRENSRNKCIQTNNTSGIPSVEWQKDANMWRVRLKYMGKKIHIGYFKDKIEAGYVRDQIIMQLHGDFAITYII